MSVVKGLPAELKMDMVSLPDSVSSYAVKIVPQNVSSVQSNTVSFGTTAGIYQITMPSTQINFDIPCGQGKNVYIDSAKTTLSFRARYRRVEGSTALSAGTLRANLIHNAFNYFNRIFHVSATGTIIDDVPNANLAVMNYLQQNLSVQEIDSLALPYGFSSEAADASFNSTNANSGHVIANFTGAQTLSTTVDKWYSYELPLPSSVIGAFAKQMFPIGSVSKLTLSMVIDDIAPICINLITATASSATVCSVLLQDFAINASYVDLGEEGSRLLGGGAKIVAGVTHRVSSTLINSTAGSVSVLMGLRGSSVRSLTTRVVDGGAVSTANSANGKYESKLLPAQYNYFLQGSTRVPPNPLDASRQPASVYMRALHASSAFSERQFKMCSTPSSFCIYSAGASLVSDADAYLSSSTTKDGSLATFMFAMGLQKVSKSKILDGLNFNSSNQFLEMTIAAAPTNSQTLYFIAELDVIYIIDNSGDVSVRL